MRKAAGLPADTVIHDLRHSFASALANAGVSLFEAGRIAFLDDEPLRLPVFNSQKLPFKWDFVNPMASPSGKRTIFSTTGHWVLAAKSANQDAAWQLIQFLSSPAFANPFGSHYGWAPVRSDVDTSKGDAQVKRINNYVRKGWDGLLFSSTAIPLPHAPFRVSWRDR